MASSLLESFANKGTYGMSQLLLLHYLLDTMMISTTQRPATEYHKYSELELVNDILLMMMIMMMKQQMQNCKKYRLQ